MQVLITFAKAASYEKDGKQKEFGEVSGLKSGVTKDREGAGFEPFTYRCDFATAQQVRQSVPALYELDIEVQTFRSNGQQQSVINVVGAAKVADMAQVAIGSKAIGIRQATPPRASAAAA